MSIFGPKTIEEARKYQYSLRSGSKTIIPDYTEGYCIERIFPNGRWPQPYQCNRKIWKDGFCKQHHPDTVAERDRKSTERYEAKKKQSAWYRLDEALKRIAELEKEIAELKR